MRETLITKHHDCKDADFKNLPEHEECAELAEIQFLEEIAEKCSCNISAGAGPTGLDSLSLRHWFLKHDRASMVLRKIVAKMLE